jgi:hypothetical protein
MAAINALAASLRSKVDSREALRAIPISTARPAYQSRAA